MNVMAIFFLLLACFKGDNLCSPGLSKICLYWLCFKSEIFQTQHDDNSIELCTVITNVMTLTYLQLGHSDVRKVKMKVISMLVSADLVKRKLSYSSYSVCRQGAAQILSVTLIFVFYQTLFLCGIIHGDDFH